MSLNARIAMSKSVKALEVEEASPAVEQVPIDGGLYTFTAEFYTERRNIRADLICPELRLSDYLNSSTPGVDIRPLSAGEGD